MYRKVNGIDIGLVLKTPPPSRDHDFGFRIIYRAIRNSCAVPKTFYTHSVEMSAWYIKIDAFLQRGPQKCYLIK